MPTLYLVRHGSAEPRGSLGDEKRRLTTDGRREVATAGAALQRIGVAPGRIVSSPLLRAVETAVILAGKFGFKGAPETLPEALPDADPADFLRRLGNFPPGGILVAGHMPHLASSLSLALTGSASAGMGFPKAGAARVDFGGAPRVGAGLLVWFLPPEVLEAIAAAGRR